MSKETAGASTAEATPRTSPLKELVSTDPPVARCRPLAGGHRQILGLVAVLVLLIFIVAGTASAAQAYTISGTVKAQSTGLGVAETQVIVREASNEIQVAATQTAMDGSYSVEAPGGTYNIEYVPPIGSGYQSVVARNEQISRNLTRRKAEVRFAPV